jgi:hypothetical protein
MTPSGLIKRYQDFWGNSWPYLQVTQRIRIPVRLANIVQNYRGFWTLSIFRYSRNYKRQRFGNCVCFRLQVMGTETATLLGPLEIANLDHWAQWLRLKKKLIFDKETQCFVWGTNWFLKYYIGKCQASKGKQIWCEVTLWFFCYFVMTTKKSSEAEIRHTRQLLQRLLCKIKP